MKLTLLWIAGAMFLAGCASMADSDVRDRAFAMMKASFKDAGQARLDRLEQDEAQRLCSEAAASKKPIDPKLGAQIEKSNLARIKFPVDGRLVGDWKAGEAIAQSGVGKQFSDAPNIAAGGNCYACHQISKQELSFGTIGPSLAEFGKIRAGMNRADLERYTYGKIYNAQAYSACSLMPRFGANDILTEQQIKDLVALLIDPASPINK